MADDGLGQPRAKVVAVNWVGSRCPPKKRSTAITFKNEIAGIFSNKCCDVDATSADDLDAKAVAKVIVSKTAAHKPLFYEFGDQKIQVADL